MGLVLRIRKLGSNQHQVFELDDTAFIVPPGSEDEQREYVLRQVMEHINAARLNKTYAQVPLKKSGPRNILRFTPSRNRTITVEWEDDSEASS